MKLTISQPQLLALIQRAGKVAAKNPLIDVLSHCRLIAESDTLRLATTDQDRFAEGAVTAEVEATGEAMVEAAAFETLIAKHPKTGTIKLELINDRLVVSCGRSKVKLPTLSTDAFPVWADVEPEAEFTLAGEDVKRGFTRVRSMAAADAHLHYLQGVHLDVHGGRLHFVATDRNCLAVSGMVAPEGADTCPKVTVPSEAVDAALRMFADFPEIGFRVAKTSITFYADDLRLACRVLEGQFVPYERAIPERGSPALVIGRADFVDSLARANLLAEQSGQYSAITIRPDGDEIHIESRNQKGGEASEGVSAVVGDGFEPFGFVSRYASLFLNGLNVSEITIEQPGPNVPHLLYSDDAPDFIGVLSPVRIAT